MLLKLIIIVVSDTFIITLLMLMKLMDSKKGGVVPPSPQQDMGPEFKEIDTCVLPITRLWHWPDDQLQVSGTIILFCMCLTKCQTRLKVGLTCSDKAWQASYPGFSLALKSGKPGYE